MSDPKLAALMKNVPAPVERIVETDMLLTIANRMSLAGRRVVVLACGHKAVTSNSTRVKCADCHRMILAGEDYDGFRNRR